MFSSQKGEVKRTTSESLIATEKEMIVLYPIMSVGHLSPMVQLAKRFISQGFSVIVVTTGSLHEPSSTNPAISTFFFSNPSIIFHSLPPVSFQPAKNSHHLRIMYDVMQEYKPKFLEFLTTLSTTTTIHAIVLDFFQTDAIDGAHKLGIPVYVFFAPGASVLALSQHFSSSHETSKTSVKDMGNATIIFPFFPPIPTYDFPKALLDRDSEIYHSCMRNYAQFLEADGILVNSFEALEPRAVKAMKEGICAPGKKIPTVYCVGPVITETLETDSKERHECFTWLDSQPKRSVLFLCFGSAGSFTAEQINAIAIGLERSGQRFLWVVRSTDDPKKLLVPQPEPDLDSLLPEGFFTRTKERGMVVKSWVPQVEVLNHESVGGFMSHCGWNSTLEAIVAGVPIICWPLYAEQCLNKVLLTEEFKVGIAIKGYNEELVSADEVEEKARWLMESKGGRMLRERMVAAKGKAVEALAEEGSSAEGIKAFVRDLRYLNGTTRADH